MELINVIKMLLHCTILLYSNINSYRFTHHVLYVNQQKRYGIINFPGTDALNERKQTLDNRLF